MAKRYILYTLSECIFCEEAKDLLAAADIQHYVFELDEDEQFLNEAKEFYKHSTVPIIVENDMSTGEVKFVGGLLELNEVINVD